MNKKILSLILAIGGAFVLSSCSARPVAGPQGEQGEAGPQGPQGEQGETGPQGEPGKDGDNGETPYIGSNGNWWIGDIDTGISAQGPQGEDGEDGHTPDISIGENGNRYIDSEDTGIPAQGPQGENGQDGHTPDISIGENGNWFIDGVDTGKPATINETHIVSFDVQGGTMPAGTPTVVQVLEGATIDSLPTPTRKDYKFLGWFIGFDVNAGQFTTTTPVYDDLQLFARWESLIPETYTITWVNYDGTVLEIDEAVQYGVVPTYDGVAPTKPSDIKYSYVFDGWSPEIKATTENITYVAQYSNSIVKHIIKFDVGEYGNLSESVVNIDGGDSIVAPSVDYTEVPDNYVLTGWYFDEEFNKSVEFPYIPNADMTFYGKWEELTDVSPYLTFYYDDSRNGYILRSYNEVYPLKTIRVPDTWDDGTNGEHPVVGMNSTFNGNQNIQTVILPETIELIGDNAFYSSTLSNIDFPSSLKEIGENAFSMCNSLSSIVLPESLEIVGESAFSFCSSLITASLPNNLSSLSYELFYGCSSLTFVELPNNLKKIGGRAFHGCNLVSVKLCESLKIIGDEAFGFNSNLTSIVLPNSLEKIGYQAFSDCDKLNSIIIPNSVEEMGFSVFFNCFNLTIYCLDLTIPENWDSTFNGDAPVYRYSPTDPGATTGNYWHYNEEGEPWKW